MGNYIMRLDDACEKRDIEKWDRMEILLDKYGIKPLVGVIPHCEDTMMDKYDFDSKFWEKVSLWHNKGWVIAMHGYNHVYGTTSGGINPVNKRSEFAGEPLDVQENKLRNGVAVFAEHGFYPKVFFAPSHTFDENTITALKKSTSIRIISDTIANKSYLRYGITFVPQQSGSVRKLPFNIVTFCYHPNSMSKTEFDKLEHFLESNHKKFIEFPLSKAKKGLDFIDVILNKLYWGRKRGI